MPWRRRPGAMGAGPARAAVPDGAGGVAQFGVSLWIAPSSTAA